ncbi:hypothetical protein SEA_PENGUINLOVER67_96 [Mycobacterium phage PenguinLover67]|nr:hypothetical protein SEA_PENGUINLOVER67_96 [Mycobacterium phage PenguinLover67]
MIYTLAIQDEGQFDHQELGRELSLEGARMMVEEIVADMEATKLGDYPLDQARADLDMDGEFIEAARYTIDPEDGWTLIAIVKTY